MIGARSVVAGDVDGDGDLDLIGAAAVVNSIAWWENPGGEATTDGTAWTEHTSGDSFAGAISVHTTDMDGDGDIDVIGAAPSAATIAWWANPGGEAATDGTLWTKHPIGTPFAQAISVNAADIDGDGDQDILGAAALDDDITWWENPGGGATTDGTTWPRHTIDGSFDGARCVYPADLDADGDVDIIGAAESANEVTWWENPGPSTASDTSLWIEHIITESFLSPQSVYAADVDGDGDSDILGAAGQDKGVTWWENPGGLATTDGTVWAEYIIDETFAYANSVFATDLDADGDTDILSAARFSDEVAWWENPGGGTVADPTAWIKHSVDSFFGGAFDVHAADMDGDGDTDVLGAVSAAHVSGPREFMWWENQTIHRNAVFPGKIRLDDFGFSQFRDIHTADVDGDGNTDILSASLATEPNVMWWENPGGSATTNREAWTGHPVSVSFNGVESVYAADIDGDGDTDVLAARFTVFTVLSGIIVWWENRLAEEAPSSGCETYPWCEHQFDDEFPSNVVHAADVDGDGNLDILSASGALDAVAWWQNPGGLETTNDALWVQHTFDGLPGGATSVSTADLNGDGDLDILAAVSAADRFLWWENPGGADTRDATLWELHTTSESILQPIDVHAADFDADGNIDIVGAGHSIAWWRNPGGAASTDGTPWTQHTVDSLSSSFNVFGPALHAADMDGDGDTDIVAGTIGGPAPQITWCENPGGDATVDGTPWADHTIHRFLLGDGARSIDLADIDGDGKIDVLGTAWVGFIEGLSWWENRGGQFGLPTVSLAPTEVAPPGEQAVLQIDAVHNGRDGDTDVELVTFELLFDDGATPLSDAQANSMIENLYVYLDDGSGDFDPADTLVDTVSTLSLTNGVQQFMFADGNADGQVMFGTARRYFVTLDLLAGGLLDLVRVTHLTESSSTAEDRDHDIPLKIEFTPNLSATAAILQEGACPAEVVRANTTLTGTQTLQATASATLGPNLFVDGDDIAIHAPVVTIEGDTTISGGFAVGNAPSCP